MLVSPLSMLKLWLAATAVASTVSAVHAASCNKAGQGIGLRNIRSANVCKTMRTTRGEVDVEGIAYTCHGESADGTYRWCEGAIEDIKNQCQSSYSNGWWAYTSGGVIEFYECTAYISEPGGPVTGCKKKKCGTPEIP